MRPLTNSADCHANFIEAVRLNRITCVRVTATGKVRFEPAEKPHSAGDNFHTLPVFDLTQLEPHLTDSDLEGNDGRPSEALRAQTADIMHFISEQLGKGMLAVPYDEALYLQDNKGGTPVVWYVCVVRTPQGDALNLMPFRWSRRDECWLLETVVAVPLLYGQGHVSPDPDPEEGTDYDAHPSFRHVGDVVRRYKDALGKHEHEVWMRAMGLLHVIQRVMATRGEVVVVEGKEALRINFRRERLGLPPLQPVVRLINLTPPTRFQARLPGEPTGRTVDPHHRRGTIVTNRYGTVFPRRATIVNDPARTPAKSHMPVPKPWYEVWDPSEPRGSLRRL